MLLGVDVDNNFPCTAHAYPPRTTCTKIEYILILFLHSFTYPLCDIKYILGQEQCSKREIAYLLIASFHMRKQRRIGGELDTPNLAILLDESETYAGALTRQQDHKHNNT